ncbi:MAG: hypothetical protein ACOYD4_09305 [Solirubrobacterales bacterium]
MSSPGALLLVLLVSILPRAEDPIPDRIGPGDVIAWAGAGGVLGGIFFVASSAPKRDRAIRWGGLAGFVVGATLYLLAFVVRVISGQ